MENKNFSFEEPDKTKKLEALTKENDCDTGNDSSNSNSEIVQESLETKEDTGLTILEKYNPEMIELYRSDAMQNFAKIMETKKNKQEKNEERVSGIIKNFNKNGYGFIKVPGEKDVFFHINNTCPHLHYYLQEGESLIGEKVHISKIENTPKGTSAQKVLCDECVAPEEWELVESSNQAFGVPEFVTRQVSGSSSLNGPSYSDMNEINSKFIEANQKLKVWKSSIDNPTSSEKFFEEFGEPQDIKVREGGGITMMYPHGEKVLDSTSVMDSSHWEVSTSGKYKEDMGMLNAEFIFPALPGLSVWKSVITLSDTPTLEKRFEILPQDMQEEVLRIAKERMLSPEEIAEKKFNKVIHNSSVEGLRQSIRLLQSPGESYIKRSSSKKQVYVPLSADERRGDFSYDTNITTYSLVVGAKKNNDSWDSYSGGFSMPVGESQPITSAEDMRIDLLNKKREQLRRIVNVEKSSPPDQRIYQPGPEKWDELYESRWKEMQEAVEKKWEEEDMYYLEEAREKWSEYEEIFSELTSAHQEVNEILNKADKLGIKLDSAVVPEYVNTKNDNIEKIKEKVTALRQYAIEANDYLANALKEKEERINLERNKKKEEENNLRIKEDLEIEQFGVSGKLLDVAMSLAEDAKNQLGKDNAKNLFNLTATADYGRQRRQNDIINTLGKDISQEAMSFYSFSRAHDVNLVLNAVCRILESNDLKEEQEQGDANKTAKIEENIIEELSKKFDVKIKKG